MAFPEFDKYRVIREICRKYCFTLFEVQDIIEGKRRFLKVLDQDLATNGVNIFNFLNGARMSSLLNSHQICKIYFYGREREHFVIVSEPNGLRTLSLYIHEAFPLPLDQVVTLTTKIARILRHAHLRGVVHGLLNPSSIYVDENEDFKIDDFGYAWIMPHLVEIDDAEAIYLSYHIAPEICQGQEKLDGRADIYSLGVILLQLLIDFIPLNYFDNRAAKNQRLNLSLQTLRKVLPDYPKRLDRIILKTLHKNPECRFQNLKQFEKELQLLKNEYLSPSPVETKSTESVHS